MVKRWNKFEVAWLILAIFLVLGSIIYSHINTFGDTSFNFFALASNISALCGVIYVICIAKQEKVAYFFGAINVVLYAIAVYEKELYLSAAYNLFYAFPVIIYGYIYWSKLENKEETQVKEFTSKQRIIGLLAMVLAVGIFALISKQFFNGNNVLMDSIVTVFTCVATFLMARKHIEQWILFIVSNFMGIVLFLTESASDIRSIDLLVMWIVYFANSIYGWVSWKKSLKIKERKDA